MVGKLQPLVPALLFLLEKDGKECTSWELGLCNASMSLLSFLWLTHTYFFKTQTRHHQFLEIHQSQEFLV